MASEAAVEWVSTAELNEWTRQLIDQHNRELDPETWWRCLPSLVSLAQVSGWEKP